MPSRKKVNNKLRLARLMKNNNTTIIKNPNIVINKNPNLIPDKDLKAPICCVLGHVDAGKTKLLDKIRTSNIGASEAGGITQNIGSSFFPITAIAKITNMIKGKFKVQPCIPGLLMIDTPGHQSFSNLRSRGTSLCDLAILVVDINEGLQKQTIESIELLKNKNVPFIVALNKVDKIWEWKSNPNWPLRKTLKQQPISTVSILDNCIANIKNELSVHGINSEFYFKNKSPDKIYSLVPVSADSGEGIADLLSVLVFLTQNWLTKKITFNKNKMRASIMEVSRDSKLGWTMDIILANGQLNVGDKVAVGTKDGAKIITIKNMLLPPPFATKSKVKWIYKSKINASAGIKIIASDLENVLAGTHLIVVNKDNQENALIRIEKEIKEIYSNLSLAELGVWISVETLGALEAFYSLLHDSKIPLKGYNIGKFTVKEFNRILSLYDDVSRKELRTILHYGSDLPDELLKIAADKNFTIICSQVVYELVEKFNELKEKSNKQRKTTLSKNGQVVFPCKLKILKQFIFNNKNPIVLGVKIRDGTLKIGTPLIIPEIDLPIGKVVSIQHNKKELKQAEKGKEVCIKIETFNPSLNYGRHFDDSHLMISHITKDSFQLLKMYFKDGITKEDKILLKQLMTKLNLL